MLQILRNELRAEELEREVTFAAATTARNICQDLLDFQRFDYGRYDVSSSLFFIKRGKDAHDSQIFIPTKYLAKKFALALITVCQESQIFFFSQMARHPSSRVTAGWIFENIIHARLLVPPVISIHQGKESHPLPDLPYTLLQGTEAALSQATREATFPFYWVPSNTNFVGINSVICTSDEVYVFQITIAQEPTTPQSGLNKLWPILDQTRQKVWNVVFVSPTLSDAENLLLKCELTESLNDVRLWACPLPPLEGNKRFEDEILQLMVCDTFISMLYYLILYLERYQ